MSSSEHDRRSARAAWPVRKHRLGAEPKDDLAMRTTPEQRLAMMWTLARDAWTFAGAAFPDYSRERTPMRVLRAERALGSRGPAS